MGFWTHLDFQGSSCQFLPCSADLNQDQFLLLLVLIVNSPYGLHSPKSTWMPFYLCLLLFPLCCFWSYIRLLSFLGLNVLLPISSLPSHPHVFLDGLSLNFDLILVGLAIDPDAGSLSGTEGVACMEQGFRLDDL